MIITRTPFRISIGGGGTDLPSYYERFGGFVISAAIDRYVYITMHDRTFTPDYFIKYSQMERVRTIDEIRHPIIREAFAAHQVRPGVEMVSIADLPAATGLGSSGSFTVGLLRAIHAFNRQSIAPAELAEEACEIEIRKLREPVGKQDQYIAATGGVTCFTFEQDGKVRIAPLRCSAETLHRLEDHLLMFFTGLSRSASSVLQDQNDRSQTEDPAMLRNLHDIKALGVEIREALEAGDTEAFAALMHRHWLRKRERSGGISNPDIDRWYDTGIANGALGGKLIGAGGGGFLLFYAQDAARLRRAMAAEGLPEIRFFFDREGSKIVAQD